MSARIAFCITTLEPGGAERQLVELVVRLPRERFDPAVVVLAPPPRAPADELVQRLAEHKIDVTFLGARSIVEAPRIYRRLQHWLTATRPELLQCFLAHANILGALAARRLNMPIVAGIRVAEQRCNGHRIAQRWTERWTDRYVCVSQDVADFAVRNMRLPVEKLIVIRNGIDVERFAAAAPMNPTELGIAGERRLLLFVGRLEADKRPAWLLDRMPTLLARLPQHDLVVVGRGPLEAALRTQAERLNLAGRIHFAGWRGDVPRLLASADALLLTSSSEGMPNAILEAMAAGLPVVATQAEGVRELLSDDPRQVVGSQDAAAWIEAVARFATVRALARDVGLGNRERAADEFSLDATAAQYAALYGSLLAARQAKKTPPKR
ncbi:MAG: glycosyltransferase [Pirellulales bacterium]